MPRTANRPWFAAAGLQRGLANFPSGCRDGALRTGTGSRSGVVAASAATVLRQALSQLSWVIECMVKF